MKSEAWNSKLHICKVQLCFLVWCGLQKSKLLCNQIIFFALIKSFLLVFFIMSQIYRVCIQFVFLFQLCYYLYLYLQYHLQCLLDFSYSVNFEITCWICVKIIAFSYAECCGGYRVLIQIWNKCIQIWIHIDTDNLYKIFSERIKGSSSVDGCATVRNSIHIYYTQLTPIGTLESKISYDIWNL